ncbi:TonB-dependent receptor [Roseiterribacter gracilis]|uniref:TonB-dependent receptor n=1 Tax=Roseiterribacter gracilis TaxID=2812848 RepID=A0A8S8XA20_9PROT|nr:TonB-dependent receptor [Rhodospirillales bacterium TMPK1]
MKRIFGLLLLAGTALASTDAFAQLEEITVTAQRREQQLQKVPLAVSAYTATDLAQLQIRQTVDLIRVVPNLVGNNNVGLGGSATYYLRGVGNTESFPTQDVPVGTYVDDVFLSRQNGNNMNLFDVERIEVLRGPQGTLFGRNTTGGAINVIMRKPADHFGGYAEASIGRFNQYELRASVDAPLDPKVLTKVSAYRVGSDGWAKQKSTGADLNGQDSYGVRGDVRFLPSERLTVDLSAFYAYQDMGNILNRIDPVTGDRTVYSGVTKGYLARFGYAGAKANNDLTDLTKLTAVTLNVNYDLGPVAINSITGYRKTEQNYLIDSTFAPPNPIAYGGSPSLDEGLMEQYSQEFKLTGKALNDRLTWVGGLFFLRERNVTDLGTGTGSATTFTVTGDRTIRNTLNTEAAYAQGDYKLTDQLTATVGLRFTHEEKKLDVRRDASNIGPDVNTAGIIAAGIPVNLHANFITPRFALTYQLDPDVMFYASSTRGAKSGGWNGRALANNAFLAFKPERVWSEEVGMRADLFNKRLRLNVTGFYAYTQDEQISAAYIVNGTRFFTVTNPADLRNYGGEFELTWLATDNLKVNANLGVQHARYTSISADVATQQRNCNTAIGANNATNIAAECNRGFVDAKGRIARPVRAPDVSFSGSVTYDARFEQLTVSPTVGLTYNNGYGIGNAGNPDLLDGSWTGTQVLWDASVAFQSDRLPNWSLTVECKNCFDRSYNVSFLSTTGIFLNTPGIWDVRLRYKF